VAFGEERNCALWNRSIVFRLTRAGQTALRPADTPAMKWASTSPVAIRTSASTKWRLMWTSVPLRVLPMYVSIDSSSQEWSMMRYSAAAFSPNIPIFSSAVLGRWVPVPTRSVTFSRRTPHSWRIPSSGSRIPLSPLYGTGRVMSEVAMQTVSFPAGFPFALRICGRGGVPMGSSRERRISSPGRERGGNSRIPSVFVPGGTRISVSWSPSSSDTGFQLLMSAPRTTPATSGRISFRPSFRGTPRTPPRPTACRPVSSSSGRKRPRRA